MTEQTRLTREMTLGTALRVVAARCSKRVALVFGDQRITYQQLFDRASNLAAYLCRHGIRKGDRIAAILQCGPEFLYMFFAAALTGAVLAPLPPRMRLNQLEKLLRDLKPALVVASSQNASPEDIEALVALKRKIHSIDHILLAEVQSSPGVSSLAQIVDQSDVEPCPSVDVCSQDLLTILYTSGTTGTPKGVIHSHRSIISPVVASLKLREMWMVFTPSLKRFRRWVRVLVRYGTRLLQTVGRQQVFFSTMAMHTISGIEAMLQPILVGDRLVLMPQFHPVRALETIQRERVTVFIGVPMTYVAMLRMPDFERYRLSSLVVCAAGAAPCPPGLAKEIQRRFRCAVHIGFGMTELGGGIAATSLEDTSDRQTETVGAPMEGVEVRIVDDRHHPLPCGSIGELACRSEGLMLGYFGSERDAESGQPVDKEGWLYTGDLAYLDESGYIHIVGRKKDVIIRGGQNVYPSKVENLLCSVEGVREAAVVGIPDAIGGESVWAFVILAKDNSLSAKQLLECCRRELEAYEVPQRVLFVQDFPRTSSGKPQKFKLQEMAFKEVKEND